jgi:hypothetical protein
MKMQQIFEILVEMKADKIADRECMKQMVARTDDNRERDREDLKRMMKEMDAKMDTNQAKATKQEEMLTRMREEINLVRRK